LKIRDYLDELLAEYEFSRDYDAGLSSRDGAADAEDPELLARVMEGVFGKEIHFNYYYTEHGEQGAKPFKQLHEHFKAKRDWSFVQNWATGHIPAGGPRSDISFKCRGVPCDQENFRTTSEDSPIVVLVSQT